MSSGIRYWLSVLYFTGSVRGKLVLDVGGGEGSFAVLLSHFENDVHVLDISDVALRKAEERGFKVHKVDASKDIFPFKSEMFDAVFCLETLEHLLNPNHCMKEMFRILKKGGMLILATPNNYRHKTSIYHVSAWSCHNLKKYIQKFGFKIIKEGGNGVIGYQLLRIPPMIVVRICTRFPLLARNWMVKATK